MNTGSNIPWAVKSMVIGMELAIVIQERELWIMLLLKTRIGGEIK